MKGTPLFGEIKLEAAKIWRDFLEKIVAWFGLGVIYNNPLFLLQKKKFGTPFFFGFEDSVDRFIRGNLFPPHDPAARGLGSWVLEESGGSLMNHSANSY